MTFDELVALARTRGITVVRADLGPRQRGRYVLKLNRIYLNCSNSARQDRCTIAHELDHATHGDDCSTPAAERRANDHAARLLISPTDYAIAEAVVGPHPGALALELDVTRAVVEAWQRAVAPSLIAAHAELDCHDDLPRVPKGASIEP